MKFPRSVPALVAGDTPAGHGERLPTPMRNGARKYPFQLNRQSLLLPAVAPVTSLRSPRWAPLVSAVGGGSSLAGAGAAVGRSAAAGKLTKAALRPMLTIAIRIGYSPVRMPKRTLTHAAARTRDSAAAPIIEFYRSFGESDARPSRKATSSSILRASELKPGGKRSRTTAESSSTHHGRTSWTSSLPPSTRTRTPRSKSR